MPPVPDPAEAMTHGVEVARPGTEEADPTDGPDRAERAERWFTGPVVVAAIASVPAMFLTALEGAPARLGAFVNAATLVVFVAETVVLLALSRDRRAWMRRHRFTIGITLATIPAVIFAIGPVQVFRLLRALRVVGAIRILRVRRIVKAGRVLRVRAGLTGTAWKIASFALSLLAAVFVAAILADPTSTTRRAADAAMDRLGPVLVLAAGAMLAGATYVIARSRASDAEDGGSETGPMPDG